MCCAVYCFGDTWLCDGKLSGQVIDFHSPAPSISPPLLLVFFCTPVLAVVARQRRFRARLRNAGPTTNSLPAVASTRNLLRGSSMCVHAGEHLFWGEAVALLSHSSLCSFPLLPLFLRFESRLARRKRRLVMMTLMMTLLTITPVNTTQAIPQTLS